ncbi:ylmG homolog protein 1-2, chloroplastic-like [Typha latifolia]|uniref:ylmG homolog protein 1-2, chloroplastic-like n=1 Tax=Typha latifolia TaxID=4733 RepID=UPI003C2AC1AE
MATVVSSSAVRILLPRNPKPKPSPKTDHLRFFPSRSIPSRALTLRPFSSSALSPVQYHRTHCRIRSCAAASSLSSAALENSFSYLRPPILAAVAGLAKYLGLFREVLVVRLMLTWFPNVPWDRQPFSALRDICDNYLALFRDVLPPFMGKFDFSYIFSLMVLEVIISLLRSNPGM